MTEIYGDFDSTYIQVKDCLKLVFSGEKLSIKNNWQNSSISANFLADYFSCCFIKNTQSSAEIKHTISFIANELLENAIKYSNSSFYDPIEIKMQLFINKLVITTYNMSENENIIKYKQFIKKILHNNLEELYNTHLENTASNPSIQTSELGLLTMLNDYHVKLGWKFEVFNSEKTQITTMVHLPISYYMDKT